MKTQTKLLVLFAITFGLFSCKCNKIVEKQQNIKEVAILQSFPGEKNDEKTLFYAIDTAWVNDLTLHAIVSYIGEDGDVEFNLVFNGMWLKSYPPKAYLAIIPSNTVATGNKKVKHHLIFDLTPLSTGNPVFEVHIIGYEQGFMIGKE